jgi:hypothetical protein
MQFPTFGEALSYAVNDLELAALGPPGARRLDVQLES